MIQYLTVSGLAALLCGSGLASAMHDHDHGKADLVIQLEDKQLSVTLHAHQADLAGFERAPRTQDEILVIEELPNRLSQPGRMFSLPKAAGCTAAGTELSGLDERDHDDHHDDETASGHQHEVHVVISATYRWTCDSPRKLKHVDIVLFEAFPAITQINAVAFLEGSQTAEFLTPQHARMKLK